MRIEIKEKQLKVMYYTDLQPGDVFNYGDNDMTAIGLKTNSGSVLIQSCCGNSNTFEHIRLSDNVPVKLRGKLIGLEVQK